MQILQSQYQTNYLTLTNLFNVLFLSVALLEFYQPATNFFAEAKKKKVLVVKHVGMGYKKVPVYKKVPYKILKVEIKKKKSKKPWKKWFKKQMIVKIPHEHHHHHGHHHGHHGAAAASEGHQTWAVPALISAPSSISDIMDAWPTDYTKQHQTSASTISGPDSSSVTQASAATQTSVPAPPMSIDDLKSTGTDNYPAYLAEAAAKLVQNQQFVFPSWDQDRADKFKSLLQDSNELKHLLGLQSTISNVLELAPNDSKQQQQDNQAYQQPLINSPGADSTMLPAATSPAAPQKR